jgi:hypothetical protein
MMRSTARKLIRPTRQFTTVPGMSAVGASSWTNPWNGQTEILHSAAQPYSLMTNTAEEAYYAEVRPNQNAYFDGKSPYTRDRAEWSRDQFRRPHSADLWVAGHFYIKRSGAIGTSSSAQAPIIFQWHDTPDAADSAGGGMGPPASWMCFENELEMQWVYSLSNPFNGSVTANRVKCGRIQQQTWHTFVSRVKANSDALNGEVDTWLDGNYSQYRGPLSTPNVEGLYEKWGLYRFSDAINFSICWAKLRVTTGTSQESRKFEQKPLWIPLT